MSIDEAIRQASEDFSKAIAHLKDEFARLQIGRASAALVENIGVEAYGSHQPMKAVANISIPDPRSVMIQPWDKSMIVAIEKGIMAAGIGLNPSNDGSVVRINIPPLTEERRADLAKHTRKLGEEAKIAVRTARQDAHNAFKKLKADNAITEDDLHGADKKLQTHVDKANGEIEDAVSAKEKDIMTV